jgi:hypothetical protein
MGVVAAWLIDRIERKVMSGRVRFALISAFMLGVAALAPRVRAADETLSNDDKPLSMGTQEWNIQTRYTGERTGQDKSLTSASVGYGKYFIDRAVLEGQLVGYYTHDDENGIGIGVNMVARYHLLVIGRFSLYGEIGAGVLESTEQIPTGGTRLNFTYFGGPGGSFEINDNNHLVGGFLFQHVSNFFIEGRDRNPIMNSIAAYIGVMHTF